MKCVFLAFIFFLFITPSFGQDSAQNTQYHDQVETAALKTGKVAKMNKGKRRDSDNKSISFFIALAILGIYGLLRLFNPKYMENLFTVISRSNLGKLAKTDALDREQFSSIVFSIMYFLSTAYVVARVYLYFQSPKECSPDLALLGMSLAAVLLAYFGKYLLVSLIAWVFRFKSASQPFFKHLLLTNQLIGVILIPISALFILCFTGLNSVLAWFAAIFLAITVIYKYLANFSYFKNLSGVSLFHFFLYLCALEILPIAMIARWIGAI